MNAAPDIRDYSVLILYNEPALGAGESEAGVLAEVAAIREALAGRGARARATGLRRLEDLALVLRDAPEPVVFNLVEGFPGRPEDANLVPAVCLAFGKGCTGNTTNGLTLGLDKGAAKAVLTQAGVPCPGGVIIAPGEPLSAGRLPAGRVIVKPLGTDASEGIEEDGVMDAAETARLEAAVRRLHAQFGQPVLVEPFVGERELNVSVIQDGGELRVLPIAEIDFSAFAAGKPRIVGYAAKWLPDSFEFNHTPRVIPAPLPEPVAERIRDCARRAWHACGMQDYGRVDFRLTNAGEPFILEVNPNPDIAPDAGFAAALTAAGIPFAAFVERMVLNAALRLQHRILPVLSSPQATGHRPQTSSPRPPAPPVTIRRTEAADRNAIMELVRATNFFREDEHPIAQEVLDESVAKGAEGHYQSFTALIGDQVAGWVCHGPIACTLGSFDVYWLAVHPATQGSGVGRKLMDFAETDIRRQGGRLVVVETAGKAVYDSTRAFYQRIGYHEAARLPEFYAPGDDTIIYLTRV